ncbi:MAG: TraB/GumN family protein [Ferruginibacter sp.]
MRLTLPTAIALLIFLFSASHSSAQDTSSKTLLWRISGNGLNKPSYLYGTMHLKDRRLFFFGDSVYKSIEASEGFAMEIDPNELIDSLFARINAADTSTLLRKLLDEKKFKSVAKKLEKKFGMPADKISRKQLMDDRDNWYSKIRKNDDMKTFMDLYLYDIAHKQGKWVGGIEDVSDQLDLKDELGKDMNIADYIDEDKDDEKRKYMEKMITVYVAADIKKIDEIINTTTSKEYNDLLLVHRNIKMSQRMDSLAHIRNSFFAVGAAHLPGETGVIKLLQNKGFNVTPVFSSMKVAPEKYTYIAKETRWVRFSDNDSAYFGEMPGKPSDLKSDGADFKIYADLVSNIVYMTAFSYRSSDETPSTSVDRITRNFTDKGFVKREEKKIVNKGVSGVELIATLQNLYYRLQIFPVKDKVFIVMAGSEKKESVYTNDVDKFLLSFEITGKEKMTTTWVDHSDNAKAFAISFPKKPGIDKLHENEVNNNYETNSYTALDMPTGTYYMLVVNDTKRGFVTTDDSLVFAAQLNHYTEMQSKITDIRNFQYEGNPAMSFSAQTRKDDVDYASKILIISRGNRSYTVAAITPKGREDYPDVTRFFRSFKLLPNKESVWEKNEAAGKVFSTWSPSGFEQEKPDTAGLSEWELKYRLSESAKQIRLMAHDPFAVVTYDISIRPLSKYYWAKSDSSFFADQLNEYFSDTSSYIAKLNPGRFDSLIYKKAVTNGNVNGVEIMVKNAAKSYDKKIRILPHGDSAYHLVVMAPHAIITNQNSTRFFDDFRFANEGIPSSKLKNKTAIILADMAGLDSASKKDASDAMSAHKFDVSDLDQLSAAYLKSYPKDTTEYRTVNEQICTAIKDIHDSAVVSFVANNYTTGTANMPELKMGMLEMLAEQKTTQAMNTLKSLLLKEPPVQGSANYIAYQLSDSLQLSAILFPEATQLFGDSILGSEMIGLAAQMIDSSLLQKDILQANPEGIYTTANRQLAVLKNDKYAYFLYNNYVIDALRKLNNKRSIGFLNGFLKLKDLDTKQNAALALLKIKQAVAPAELRKIAADKFYRVDFYKALKENGKAELFPAEFLTQQQFAEAYMYEFASEESDDEEAILKPVGERVAIVKGVQRRFFLFKISFDYGGETEAHLGICGPFDMNRKDVELKGDTGSKFFYDEKFEISSVKKLFDEFIVSQNINVDPTAEK